MNSLKPSPTDAECYRYKAKICKPKDRKAAEGGSRIRAAGTEYRITIGRSVLGRILNRNVI